MAGMCFMSAGELVFERGPWAGLGPIRRLTVST
jgi:hypothetical protein